MDCEFNPIIIRYEGLDAARHLIDLGQVGASIQGASQLLGSAAHLVTTGQYAKRSLALSVRVFAGIPRDHCWEMPAVIMTAVPAMMPTLPAIADAGKKAATSAVTGIFNYVLKKMSGGTSEAQMAFQFAEKALLDAGQTTRHAMDVVERMAANLRPAARLFIVPIGQSCAYAQVGELSDGAVAIDKTMRDAIEAPEPMEIGGSDNFDILISELDLQNRSCKFSIIGQTPNVEPSRLLGEITDPLLHVPGNPYSAALNHQRPLSVVAKPQLKDGEIEKLYISDVITRPPLLAATT